MKATTWPFADLQAHTRAHTYTPTLHPPVADEHRALCEDPRQRRVGVDSGCAFGEGEKLAAHGNGAGELTLLVRKGDDEVPAFCLVKGSTTPRTFTTMHPI